MSTINIDTSDRGEQRKFGLVMAVAISVVTVIHGLIRGHFAVWPFYLVAAFAVLGLVAPKLLQPVFVVWIKFAEVVNWVMTRLLLGIVFFLMITPTRIVRSLMGLDAMQRTWDADAATFWEEAEAQPESLDDYKNMF